MRSAEAGAGMSAHTPGPWKAVTQQTAAEFDCMEIADISHMRVVPESGGWPTPGKPEDDARLIAAAPDLLSALQELVGWQTCAPDEAVAAAHAAIAKATGEQAT